jgi:Cd2+/Zn2+-exporting ATPase
VVALSYGARELKKVTMTDQRLLTIPLSLRENGECAHCTIRLIDDIKRLKGIKKVEVTDDPSQIHIEYDLNFTSLELIENFAIRQGLKLKSHYNHKHYRIEGLDCPDCAAKLEQRISKIPGVTWASLNFATSQIWFEYEPDVSAADVILSAIEKAGYQYRELEISQVAQEISTSSFILAGLDCPDCAAKLQSRLSKMEGVAEVLINFSASTMTIKHDQSLVHRRDIIQAVEESGYKATISTSDAQRGAPRFFTMSNQKLVFTALSAILILCGMVSALLKSVLPLYSLVSVAGHSLTLSHLFYLFAIVSGGYYFARSAYYSILAKSLDMNVLMSVAIIGAIAIGEVEEGAMVAFLFALGNLLQSYTLDRARNALKLLMDLAPQEANLKRGGTLVRVPLAELRVGDIIVVKPGEKVPVDGIVVTGESAINESPITGESQPADKVPGSNVFAGSINGGGALEIRMEKLTEDSTLSRIIHLVEEAQAQKAPSQNFVERFSRIYTPLVISGAFLIMVIPPLLFSLPFTDWFYRGLMLLVISCPCALVISTPVSIVSALACSSRKGILIKGGTYLEEMGSINAIAFDKTGTLTRARLEVTDLIPLNGGSENEFLGIAASLEMKSEHPLSKAIIRKARQNGVSFREPFDFIALPGKGMKGRLDGEWGYIGNITFLSEQGLPVNGFKNEVQRLEQEGKTTILLHWGSLQGIIGLADIPREEAKQCIEGLKEKGIKHIALLSGDNERAVSALAGQMGIDESFAGMLPEEKVEAVKQLLSRYGKVAMVGDGVNDAPALAVSTVGIAMGVAGTDTALETADVALMSDDLLKLPFLVHLSRRTLTTIKTNIGFSIFVKAAFIVFALLGITNLWMAVAADMGTSLLVTLYGMRLITTDENT